jgi:hypothetical protein
VQLGRAIHAQSDEEAVRREELTPFVVQERPVGLDRVLDALARSPVLLAQPYRFLEERGSAQCRLAALPADRHSAVRLRIQIAADEPVQHLGGHLLGLVAPQNLLGQEEAVRAVEVAGGARRLRDQRERQPSGAWRWRLRHAVLLRWMDVNKRRWPSQG